MFKTDSLLLVLLTFFLAACIPPSTPTGTVALPTAASRPADWYSVYFTEPDSPTAGSFRGGPDSALAIAIRNARLSVDMAVYHLNLWSIRDALIAAHQAGVAVRVVAESDNMDEVEISELQQAGIEVLGDRRESFMHQKFVIIDRYEVWTGSMNFTINGAYRNNNNLIRIRSSQLAENFTAEFEEMFLQDMFGDDVVFNTPHPQLILNGTKIETYFSPDDRAETRVLTYIQNAEESIDFMVYSFTSDKIAEALLAKANQGVAIRGVFEEGQYYTNMGGEFDTLLAAGLDVHLDGNRSNMHHKVMLIDREILITGSYNFSRNAEMYNDENILIIIDPVIANLYAQEFERVYAQAPSVLP
jgi:phosphatidylserine/phosphatidylglycerophosphate/cardiolipin synthase-like enzyme